MKTKRLINDPGAKSKSADTTTYSKVGNRVFDSMGQAAAMTGLGLDALRMLKRTGCPAFHATRVNEAELLAWISTHPVESIRGPVTLRDQKLKEEIRKLRVVNDAKQGALASRAKVAASLRAMAGKVRAILDQKLEQEMPAAMAGLDVPGARVYGKRLNDQICEAFAALAKEWEWDS